VLTEKLGELGWEGTYDLVEDRMSGVLAESVGEEPSYDTLIGLSYGVHAAVNEALDVDRFLFEVVIRRFYGESELTRLIPSGKLQFIELVLIGVITGPPPVVAS
jgi:hypothetical protein